MTQKKVNEANKMTSLLFCFRCFLIQNFESERIDFMTLFVCMYAMLLLVVEM